MLGVLLVAITALAGAKLLSSADDTTTIWAAKHDLPAGTKLTGDDLTTARVRFTSGEDAGQYVAADADLKGLVVTRAVDAGRVRAEARPPSPSRTATAPSCRCRSRPAVCRRTRRPGTTSTSGWCRRTRTSRPSGSGPRSACSRSTR